MDHYAYYLQNLDLNIRHIMHAQCLDESSPIYGAVDKLEDHLVNALDALKVAARLLEGYYTPGSAWERNPECLQRVLPALRFARGLVREDGTEDLLETNFFDASETAFSVQAIGPATMLMREKTGNTPLEEEIYATLLAYINHAADGMIHGGFHTPNHRWVHSSALAICENLTGRKECLDRMQQFLNEGIDCDEEGEFTERSAGVYNIVCDKSMIYLATLRNMPELLNHVTRNLNMVLKYVEPDFTINTMNSTRQDFGKAPSWTIYYAMYLYMAIATESPDFLAVADAMLKQLSAEGRQWDLSLDVMNMVLLDPDMQGRLKKMVPAMPEMDCNKLFERSGIARYRKDNFSFTFLRNQPAFAKLQFGAHTVYLRMSGCFFAKGQFVGQTLEKIGDSYRMTYRVRWGYKGPLPENQGTSDWREMDHSKRPDILMQDYGYDVTLTPIENGVTIQAVSIGTDRVPVKLEIMLDPGSRYETDAVDFNAKAGTYVYQKCGKAIYRYADAYTFHIDGGFHAHTSGEYMRGSVFGSPEKFTVALTAYTPMDQTIRLYFD